MAKNGGQLSATTEKETAEPLKLAVFFDEKSDLIDARAVRAIENFAEAYRSQHEQVENAHVVLVGHASDEGSEYEMMSLGCSRAKSFKAALLTILPPMGITIKSENIETVSFGGGAPAHTGTGDYANSLNRRAELVFSSIESASHDCSATSK